MPGSYAHITLVNQTSEKRRLKKSPDSPVKQLMQLDSADDNFWLSVSCHKPSEKAKKIARRG